MKKLLVILIGLFLVTGLSGCAASIQPKNYVDVLPKERAVVVGKVDVYGELSQESAMKYMSTHNPEDLVFSGTPNEYQLKMGEYLRKAMEKRLQEAGFSVIHEGEALPPRYLKMEFKMAIRPSSLFSNGAILGLASVHEVSGETERKLSMRDFGQLTSALYGDDWAIDPRITGLVVQYMKETFLPL